MGCCCSGGTDGPDQVRTPFQKGGLSSAFLTRALRHGETIDEDTAVASFDVKKLNEIGVSFGDLQEEWDKDPERKSEKVRVVLKYSRTEGYDRNSSDSPRTIVAKFGSTTNYNEVCFYRHAHPVLSTSLFCGSVAKVKDG